MSDDNPTTNTDADEPKVEEAETTPISSVEAETFELLRDAVRSRFIWQWEADATPVQERIEYLTGHLGRSRHFRLVGDIEIEDHIVEMTLWLEARRVVTLSTIDRLLLEALKLDFRRGLVISRQLRGHGLEYHLITYGDGIAVQYHVAIIGPRMQQIRDLGVAAAAEDDRFQA